jgi:hypothetical protein
LGRSERFSAEESEQFSELSTTSHIFLITTLCEFCHCNPQSSLLTYRVRYYRFGGSFPLASSIFQPWFISVFSFVVLDLAN